jgi:hypothetical protein
MGSNSHFCLVRPKENLPTSRTMVGRQLAALRIYDTFATFSPPILS